MITQIRAAVERAFPFRVPHAHPRGCYCTDCGIIERATTEVGSAFAGLIELHAVTAEENARLRVQIDLMLEANRILRDELARASAEERS